MNYQTLIIPGLKGSGTHHWQSWLQKRVPDATVVDQENWDNPLIVPWARAVNHAIRNARDPVILVAHSFGVLASVMGAASIADKVVGALFVAPADPSRFTVAGDRVVEDSLHHESGLYNYIPKESLGYPSTLVASLNDPCISFKQAATWATRWNSRLVSIGHAGHVNVESGYGAWPNGLTLYQELVASATIHHADSQPLYFEGA